MFVREWRVPAQSFLYFYFDPKYTVKLYCGRHHFELLRYLVQSKKFTALCEDRDTHAHVDLPVDQSYNWLTFCSRKPNTYL